MNPFTWSVRIYYEDTDAGGVVYYANYLKYMERARTEWLRNMGYEQDRLIDKERLIFAVKQIQVDYLKPARFNDELTVSVEVTERGAASLRFRQNIKDQQQQLLCEGHIMIVSLDTDSFKPRRLPAHMIKEIGNVH